MPFPRRSINPLLAAGLLLLIVTICPASTHPVRAQHAMVVTVHQLASHVGVEILQAGGNAIDATVATGCALAVVHSPAGNIGGGGFMLIRMADGKTPLPDYREKAPGGATRDMYLDPSANVMPRATQVGYKSIAAHGAIPSITRAEQKYA